MLVLFILCSAFVLSLPNGPYFIQGISNLFPVLACVSLCVSILVISTMTYISVQHPQELVKIRTKFIGKSSLNFTKFKIKFIGLSYAALFLACAYQGWYFLTICFIFAAFAYMYIYNTLFKEEGSNDNI